LIVQDGISVGAMLAMLDPPELIIILVIVLVLFGGAKLPKLAKSLGEAQREFKKGTDGEPSTAEDTVTPTPPVAVTPPAVAAPVVAPPPVVVTPPAVVAPPAAEEGDPPAV
jgi:sec-independent protein translocase protein TatA